MSTVGVNPPKTPVTEGSGDTTLAALPNVCKMPGPPAPFVPTPLPNLGKSSDNLSECTTTVLFEGHKVAIKGSYYMSSVSGDMVSKGTGGGIVSATEEGKTSFAAPGSMNVKAEGKNIQLLGDAMFSNGNANNAGAPANVQGPIAPWLIQAMGEDDAKTLCAAICKAKNDPNAVRKESAVAKQLSGKGPPYTPKPGSNLMAEVGYKIPKSAGKGFLRLVKSLTGRIYGSVARSLNTASKLGKGNVVIMDVVQVINPNKPPIPSNVKNYIEIKDLAKENEPYTKNQEKALRKMKDRAKVKKVTPKDCGC